MSAESLDLTVPVAWDSPEEQRAAVAFFNAAYRAEESGLRQAHEMAGEVETWDPELALALRLYGDEEGWHRQLLAQFLAYLGGGIRPMGPTTCAFYSLYARARRHETIVLTNLMFETIGATTYRIALRTARPRPAVRQMLTILARDESFHVPLNLHFLRRVLARAEPGALRRLRPLYHALTAGLMASAAASRRRARRFDRIDFLELARAYADHLGRLFVHASDLELAPSRVLLATVGLRRRDLEMRADPTSPEAAEQAADRSRAAVEAL